MDEARKFLRYVIPGLVLGIEVFLYFLLSSFNDTVAVIKKSYNQLSISTPITVFLVSGGVGFLVQLIYHSLCKLPWIRGIVVDHRRVLDYAVRRGWLVLRSRDSTNGEADNIELTQEGAWRVATTYWHERIRTSKIIESAGPRIELLVNTMHSLGITCVGSIFAFLTWLYLQVQLKPLFPLTWLYVAPVILFISLFIFHFCGFKHTVEDFQGVVDSIISDALRDEFKENKIAIIYVSSRDVDKRKIV